MTCSGLHREFQHKCKGISMSKWTANEVKAIEAGGNTKASRLENCQKTNGQIVLILLRGLLNS